MGTSSKTTDNNPTNVGNAANKAGVWIYQSHRNVFRNNTVRGNRQFGFFLSESNDNAGTGKGVTGNPGGNVVISSGVRNSIQ